MTTMQSIVDSMHGRYKTFMTYRIDGSDHEISYSQMHAMVTEFSKGLLEKGLRPGDHVGIYTKQHPLMIPCILGVDNAGLVDMPRDFTDMQRRDIRAIIGHSEPRIAIIEGRNVLEHIDGFLPHDRIYSLEHIDGIRDIKEIYAAARGSMTGIPRVKEGQLASILYTSGTTGEPKGVMLTHGNYLSNYEAVFERIPVGEQDIFLSALPFYHAYPRAGIMIAAMLGARLHCVANLKNAPDEIKAYEPTVFPSVPRVWDNIKKKFNAEIREKGENLVRLLEKAHIRHSQNDPKKIAEYWIEKDIEAMVQGNHSPKARAIHAILDKAIYSQIRENLGGHLKHVISGGSAMPQHLMLFYMRAGFNFYQGYGLTESSPIIAGDRQDMHDLAAVGKPLNNVMVEIRDEQGKRCADRVSGTIFARGPNIMQGYYKNEALTARVIEDGWLNTGDIGHLVASVLTITGRAADEFKLGNGMWLNPTQYESLAEDHEEVDAAIVVGKDWKAPGILICPNMGEISFFARKHGIRYNEECELLTHPKIIEIYKDIVANINGRDHIRYKLQGFKLIADIRGCVTSTQKIQRQKVHDNYKGVIEGLAQEINS